MQRDERVVHGEQFSADALRLRPDFFPRHHPGRSSARNRVSDETVSVVTRTAYREEQFSGPNRSRINRHAGHPGHGVEARGNRDTQSSGHLNRCALHRVSNGLMVTRKTTGPKPVSNTANFAPKWLALDAVLGI